MTQDSYRFIVRRGPQPNQVFELNKDVLTLGRDITNDITINDPEVSRHHLRITRGTDGFTLEDLGSTNGTFINGQRLTGSRPLSRGDMIGLGETVTLTYDVARPQQQPQQPPGQSQYAPPPGQYSQPQQPPAPGQQPPSPYAPPPNQQPPGQYSQPQQPPSPYAPQPQYGQPAGQPNYYQGQVPPVPGQQPPYDGGYDPVVDYNQVPPGHDYDPYAVRDEESPSTWRWVVIGCAGLLLFCCCASVIGLVIIDTARLWCELPIFKDIVTPIAGAIAEALGIVGNSISCR